MLESNNVENNKVILVTYQSLELLVNVVKDCEIEIDLMCFDEAHHVTSEGIGDMLFGINNKTIYDERFINTHVNKKLYFTATPKNANGVKMYERVQNVTVDGENYDEINTGEPHCGPLVFDCINEKTLLI